MGGNPVKMLRGALTLNLNSLSSSKFLLFNGGKQTASVGAIQANSSSTQVDETDTNNLTPEEKQRQEEEDSLLRFEPWKKHWWRFIADMSMSALTYVITYWFLHRIGILNFKNFNNRIKENIRNSGKPKYEIEKDIKKFDDVLLKLTKNDPINSSDYWRDYYDKHILDRDKTDKVNFNKLSKWDQFVAKFYRSVYGSNRRWSLSAFISILSLGRAWAIHPDLSWFTGAFVFVGPWLTNLFFWQADEQARQHRDNVGGEWSDIKKLKNVTERSGFAEKFNLGYKVLAKALKRSENPLMFSIAATGSFMSRFFRDFLEDGLPKADDSKLGFIGKSQFVQKLRNMKPMQIGDKKVNVFEEGVLAGADEFKIGENHLVHLTKIAAIKTAFKYVTDYAIFGLIGVSALKIAYFIKHMFQNKQSQPGNSQPQMAFNMGGLTSSISVQNTDGSSTSINNAVA